MRRPPRQPGARDQPRAFGPASHARRDLPRRGEGHGDRGPTGNDGSVRRPTCASRRDAFVRGQYRSMPSTRTVVSRARTDQGRRAIGSPLRYAATRMPEEAAGRGRWPRGVVVDRHVDHEIVGSERSSRAAVCARAVYRCTLASLRATRNSPRECSPSSSSAGAWRLSWRTAVPVVQRSGKRRICVRSSPPTY